MRSTPGSPHSGTFISECGPLSGLGSRRHASSIVGIFLACRQVFDAQGWKRLRVLVADEGHHALAHQAAQVEQDELRVRGGVVGRNRPTGKGGGGHALVAAAREAFSLQRMICPRPDSGAKERTEAMTHTRWMMNWELGRLFRTPPNPMPGLRKRPNRTQSSI